MKSKNCTCSIKLSEFATLLKNTNVKTRILASPWLGEKKCCTEFFWTINVVHSQHKQMSQGGCKPEHDKDLKLCIILMSSLQERLN